MGITERREAEKEAIRKKIMDAASEIMIEEGFDKLSIRKIAAKIEYSPAVIYHYFKDKAEIVQTITMENYGRILEGFHNLKLHEKEPIDALRTGLTQFIYLMLENPHQLHAAIRNDLEVKEEGVRSFNTPEGSVNEATQIMVDVIDRGMIAGVFKPIESILAARLLWIAGYGMLVRAVVEKMNERDGFDVFIEQYVNILVDGILLK